MRSLAYSILGYLNDYGFANRGVKERSSDAYLMDTNLELRQIGIADAQGIAEFYGLTYGD